MSIATLNFESMYLKSNHQISIILPDKPRDLSPKSYYESGKKYKVLWLLHGTYGDHTDWLRRTNIELYACEKNLIVVMPSALNSNYSNWDQCMMGFGMYDYLTEELMPLIYNWFPASDKREDNFIAGLSMGGRGTIKFAANHPDKFAAAAVLSAAPTNFQNLTEEDLHKDDMFSRRMLGMVQNAGGLESFKNSSENVWDILSALAGSGRLPKLLFACGTADTMIYENLLLFKKHAEEIGLDAEFWTLDGYEHEWRFWDLAIQHALQFFGLEDTGASPY
ncbi:alpha/beta hydrolase [Cohnella hashimotonis]|uniref:Alpha/beta hydrolase family protein n=1 Tax=Cohnella hashimotonis TaxID=2826895 RepID=A0ABT6TEC8_9BACL|nr:alpha/beta hydrolase family protein [Cohnella hashimotonis]MDI4645167.1 alpha/beta hydrolase family protein [Cohnella hashimotonis]